MCARIVGGEIDGRFETVQRLGITLHLLQDIGAVVVDLVRRRVRQACRFDPCERVIQIAHRFQGDGKVQAVVEVSRGQSERLSVGLDGCVAAAQGVQGQAQIVVGRCQGGIL